MLYTLYYQKSYGDTVVVTKSKSLLKLLKIKLVTYGWDARAFISAGCEEFDKFDLSADDLAQYNAFEVKAQGGRYFPTYDYSQRGRSRGILSV